MQGQRAADLCIGGVGRLEPTKLIKLGVGHVVLQGDLLVQGEGPQVAVHHGKNVLKAVRGGQATAAVAGDHPRASQGAQVVGAQTPDLGHQLANNVADERDDSLLTVAPLEAAELLVILGRSLAVCVGYRHYVPSAKM